MDLRLQFACVVAVVLMVGCSSASQPSLDHEVRRLAFAGEDARRAEASLKMVGFSCASVSVPNFRADRQCDRIRGYWVLASCVQRAYLTLDATHQRIHRTDVAQPACTGM